MKHFISSVSKDSQSTQRIYRSIFNNTRYSSLNNKNFAQQRQIISPQSRQFHYKHQSSSKENQSQSFVSYLTSLLFVGGISVMMYQNFKNQNSLEALEQHKIDQEVKQRYREQFKAEDISSDSKRKVLYSIYDSSNALHKEFQQNLKTRDLYNKILKRYRGLEVVSIDVSQNSIGKDLLKQFLDLSGSSQGKISKKKTPSFVLRADNRLTTIRPSNLDNKYNQKFNKTFQKETSTYSVRSIKELADYLGQFNRDLNDTTVVYFNDQETQNKESTKTAFRLMRQETRNPILVIDDHQLGDQLKMDKGKFYIYFKPSFINGFEQYQDKDINFNYLQAFEGVCRDSFEINTQYVESSQFKEQLEQSNGIFTERFSSDIFDQCFSRSFNVEFVFNTNMKEFGKKFKYGQQAEKPILFVYSPTMYMSRYVGEFKEVLKNYKEVFDIYYTGNEKRASKFFYTREFPEIIPYVVIIDTKKRKALKSEDGLKELTLQNNNFYFTKNRELVFFNNIQKDLNKLIDKYLDGELHHFYQSERMKQKTKVKQICAQNFEEQVVNNDQVKHCIIEIFKHDCPSCAFNGKVFNVFSRKLEKHGYLDKIQCFRLSIDNKIPYLGNFGYSPIYFYVKKNGNQIVEIKTLDAPQRMEAFLSQIEEESQIEGFRDKIKIKARDQVLKHIKLEDIKEDFDIDFDTKEEEPKDVPKEETGKTSASPQQQQSETK